MPQLVDIHGLPVDLEQVSAFRIVPREAIYYPAYQETQEMKSSLFAKFGAQDKKKFQFVSLVPFGILLDPREKPYIGDYKVESFAEAAGQSILAGLGNAFTGAGNLIADALSIDTSINQQFRILTVGRRIVDTRLRDLPAKVRMLSGKVADVYKNDPIYPFLGEPISPTINRTKALFMKIGRESFAFYGSGIDMTDEEIDAAYHALLDSYNTIQRIKDEQKSAEKNRPLFQMPNIQLPKFELPKINIPIRFQSPFVFDSKNEQASPEKPDSTTSTVTPDSLEEREHK